MWRWFSKINRQRIIISNTNDLCINRIILIIVNIFTFGTIKEISFSFFTFGTLITQKKYLSHNAYVCINICSKRRVIIWSFLDNCFLWWCFLELSWILCNNNCLAPIIGFNVCCTKQLYCNYMAIIIFFYLTCPKFLALLKIHDTVLYCNLNVNFILKIK